MNIKKVKPVLRVPGSKANKIQLICDTLKLTKDDNFLDHFGGGGIVGVNVYANFGCETQINDFDGVLPVTDEYALKNMLSFQGLGKSYTVSAQKYFLTRIRNGYWDKVDRFNDVITHINISNLSFEDIDYTHKTAIYVDPPYDDINGLYKKDFSKEQHIKLFNNLNSLNGAKILVSYNDTPFIRELYKDWKIKTEEFSYHTGRTTKTRKKKKVKELWITKNI